MVNASIAPESPRANTLLTGALPRAVLAVLLFVAALAAAMAWQRPAMFGGLNIYDEGIILFGAVRVMNGDLPYRDFWTQYSPAQYYFLASLFSITGKSAMAARWWDVLVRALLAVALYLLAARSTSWRSAWIVWLLGVLWLTYYGFFSYPLFQGLLFSCLCLFAYLKGLDSRRWMFGAGLLLGVSFAFRHDMSIYLMATITLVSALYAVVHRLPVLALVRRLLPLVAGGALLIVPIALFFMAQVNLLSLATQLFIFPLTEFPRVRDLPYPTFKGSVENVPFYAPFLIYGLTLLLALLRLWRPVDARDRMRAFAMVAMALFGFFGFNQARVRSDLIHTVHFFVLAMALLPALFRGLPATLSRAVWVPSFVISMLSLTLLLALFVEPLDHYFTMRERNLTRAALAGRVGTSSPVAEGILLEDWQQGLYTAATFYLQPGDALYIGLRNHDKVFANDVMSYYLLDRKPLTRYHEMHPAIVDTAPVQEEMIAEFERARPSVIFLSNMFDGASEPNDANKSTKVELLDDYIKKHYIQYGSSGPYSILRRRKGM